MTKARSPLLSYRPRLTLLGTLFAILLCATSAQAQTSNWQSHWAIPPGYFLEVDTAGYTLPVSIAFVPNPGSKPEDPLYYVSELGGRIIVVRNDRKKEVFAESFFALNSNATMPDISGVIGMTGLCLDAGTGYLFAGYVYDSEQGRFNGLTRFSTTPGKFSLRPTAKTRIHKPFMLGDSAFTRFPFGHQIGACQIIDNTLYVGIGDGELAHRPRSDQSSFGKILHMRLDGTPVGQPQGAGNPSEPTLADYIYASGLRNPFGQTAMGGNLVVADNGPGIDRVLMVRKGKDYLYDGSDASIATNSMVVLAPAKGTAHVTFYPENAASNIKDLNNHILVVQSGVPETYLEEEPAEIAAFAVEPDTGHVTSRPRSLVKYVGKTLQVLSSVAIADDGIYFAPVYGEQSKPQDSNVYRLSWAPEKKYPTSMRQYTNARAIIRNNGCRGCHSIRGDGGNVGPNLSREDIRSRNLERVNSPEFTAMLQQMNQVEKNPALIAARKRILGLQGDKRLMAWVEEKILEPAIDNNHSIMPLLSLKKKEAKTITRFLMKGPKPAQPKPAPAPKP